MFKTANVGSLDRLLRIVIGLVLIAAPYFYASVIWETPLLRWLVPIIGVVLVATAFLHFCPLYRLIGVNTCKIG